MPNIPRSKMRRRRRPATRTVVASPTAETQSPAEVEIHGYGWETYRMHKSLFPDYKDPFAGIRFSN